MTKKNIRISKLQAVKSVKTAFAQLKNLTAYKNKTDAELLEIAKRKVEVDDIGVVNIFKESSERTLAKQLLHKYLDDYSISTVSDKNILKDLIYYEVVQLRLQTIMNKLHSGDKAVPTQYLDTLHSNSKQILSLKSTLGLNKSQEEKQGNYDVLEHKIKRHKQWMNENQGSRTLPCAYCGKMMLLKIRIDIWEAQKHPFFRDKMLFNRHLTKMYLRTQITKEDYAATLEFSPDYVDWLLEKIKMNPEFKEIQQEVTNEAQAKLAELEAERDKESG